MAVGRHLTAEGDGEASCSTHGIQEAESSDPERDRGADTVPRTMPRSPTQTLRSVLASHLGVPWSTQFVVKINQHNRLASWVTAVFASNFIPFEICLSSERRLKSEDRGKCKKQSKKGTRPIR